MSKLNIIYFTSLSLFIKEKKLFKKKSREESSARRTE